MSFCTHAVPAALTGRRSTAPLAGERHGGGRGTAWLRRAVLVLAALLAPVAASAGAFSVEEFDLRIGDDTAWRRVRLSQVPEADDALVLRAHVEVPPGLRGDGRPLAVYFGAMASHEIWWDGVLIGRGGVVGRTAAAEVPGPIEAHYQVPDRLAAAGPHQVTIRASAFHRHFVPRQGYWAFLVGDYDTIVAQRRGYAWIALMALSGIALTGAFALAMFRLPDRPFLLLALLCATAAALLVVEIWRPLVGYTYDRHILRLVTVAALSWLVGVQTVALLVVRFPHRLGRAVVVGAALVAAAALPVPGWDVKALLMFLVCFVTALGWAAFAVRRRLSGGVLALAGCAGPVVALAVVPLSFADAWLYVALDFLFACLLCSHALEVRRERHERTEALLKMARLELEMVKRHIQPHFLMNTLTALSELVERDAAAAVRMIESLAEEFRTLSDIAQRKLIGIEEELRLCRSHLVIMSLRKDTRYELRVEGLGGSEQVPPAVFHTLIENAVTHGPTGARRVEMRLAARREGVRLRYCFETAAGEAAAGDGRQGTGTHYIEARLREAWGDAWTFAQWRDGATWRAEIVVPAEASS